MKPPLDPGALDGAFATARGHALSGRAPFTIRAVADGARTLPLETATEPGRDPVSADAQCLIASITKPIVATAGMRLHQEAASASTRRWPGGCRSSPRRTAGASRRGTS